MSLGRIKATAFFLTLSFAVYADEALVKPTESFTAMAQIEFMNCATAALSESSIAKLMERGINAMRIGEMLERASKLNEMANPLSVEVQ